MQCDTFAASVGGLVLALLSVTGAAADGEAGLVIQDGDVVRTYCVAFSGDGIRGDELLKQAGHEFEAYGGGSGLALCAIDHRGCQDAGSFSSCFCECQGGDCTYWAFFTREYAKNWVYSARAFNLLSAGDGDVHGWKWGKGAAQSAPAPQDVSFEQICGHAPRGGAAPQPTTAATSGPQPSTQAPATQTSTAVAGTVSAPLSESVTAPATTGVTPLVTLPAATSPAPPPPAAGDESGAQEGGGDSTGLVVVGLLAVALLGAIGLAAVWRRRRGT